MEFHKRMTKHIALFARSCYMYIYRHLDIEVLGADLVRVLGGSGKFTNPKIGTNKNMFFLF